MEDYIELEGVFENGYGFISKKVMLDTELSLASKGVYAYFCSFSGKGKDVYPSRTRICNDLKISNDSLGKYLKELTNKGYLEITHHQNNGKFMNNVYKICLSIPCQEKPYTKIPYTKKPYTKISDTVNLDTNNNISINNNIYNNNNINNNNIYKKEIYKEKSLGLSFENEFEEVWSMYPKKIGKVNSMKSFIKARTKGTTLEEIKTGLNNYLKYIKVEKVKTQYIKNGSTWFNQECWNDDYSIKRELTTGDIAEFMDFSSFRED